MIAVYDQNHGADRTTVFHGPLAIQGGSVAAPALGAFEVTIPCNPPFAYVPALGDLTIDFMSAGFPAGVTMPGCDYGTAAGTARARRMFQNGSQFAAQNTSAPTGEGAMVIEFTCAPVTTNLANFDATPRRGPSPLAVHFTDSSWSPSPGGVTSWQWDFEDDGVVDATDQHPVHVYPCGTWNVRLTVDDGAHGPATVVRSGFVVTDEVVAGFTWTSAAAGTVQFADATAPPASSWAWDFDGDGVTDSTLPNPTWNYGACGVHDVRLTAASGCGPPATAVRRVVSAPSLDTTLAGGNGGAVDWASLFDLVVANPLGVEICGLDLRANAAAGTAFAVDVWICPVTCVGNESNAAVWRRVAQGSGVSSGNGPGEVRSFVAFATPGRGVYLAPGSHGFMIHHRSGSGMTYSGATTPGLYGNADLAFRDSRVRAGLFSGALFAPRVWNGSLHYATCSTSGEASYGVFELGCPGSLGVPGNECLAEPRLGASASASFTNLPQDAAIVVLGLGNSVSPFGPLPLELTPFGMPGCFGRVSPDSVEFVLGAGNRATWSLFVPNAAMYLCTRLYTQAIALDAGANAGGATLSDAAAMVVGQ
jgi:PKD repeat protein